MKLLSISLLLFFFGEREVGMASYYADHFHGKRTASGDLYHTKFYTAAHRTLKFGTIVWVKNIKTQDSVQVCINDRGPHIAGIIIDVSKAAAVDLQLIGPGKAKVEVWVE